MDTNQTVREERAYLTLLEEPTPRYIPKSTVPKATLSTYKIAKQSYELALLLLSGKASEERLSEYGNAEQRSMRLALLAVQTINAATIEGVEQQDLFRQVAKFGTGTGEEELKKGEEEVKKGWEDSAKLRMETKLAYYRKLKVDQEEALAGEENLEAAAENDVSDETKEGAEPEDEVLIEL